MNALNNDCFISIIDTICPVKWSPIIRDVSKYETGDRYCDYSSRSDYIKDFINTTKLSYTQMWDVLTSLEKLHSTSDNEKKQQIETYFNMSAVADFADELIKIIKKHDGNIPYKMTSILQPENEYDNRMTYHYMFNIKYNTKKILNREIYVPYTHSNQSCIVCDKQLPFDWPSKEQHKHGVCSTTCYKKCSEKYPTMTLKCLYNRCNTEIPLINLERVYYSDCDTNDEIIKFYRDCCSEGCATDDYENKHTFNRLDAYLDY